MSTTCEVHEIGGIFMAVSFGSDDVISLEEYGPEFLIPLHARHRLEDVTRLVTLLTRGRGKELVGKFHPFPSYPFPFDPERYHASDEIAFDLNDARDVSSVEKWFSNLPVKFDENIYLYWKIIDWQQKGCPALVTSWGAFTQSLWNIVWNPFEFMTVIDDSADWAVMLGPEPFAIFIERGGVNPELPKSDPAYGLGLIRVRPNPSDGSDSDPSE